MVQAAEIRQPVNVTECHDGPHLHRADGGDLRPARPGTEVGRGTVSRELDRPGPGDPSRPVPLRRPALPREVLVSTTTAGILFLASLIIGARGRPRTARRLHVPGLQLRQGLCAVERVIYRLIGADPKSEQTWGAYARSVLAFSAVSVLFLFVLQLVQGKLPLHLNDPGTPMTPALAWNTAVSFVTNTNWQAYSGESTQGHLVQMAGLAVQNFVSAAVGMAVAMAFVRGFARRNTGDLGNFWVDLVRGTIRILLPLSVDRRDHPDRRRRHPELRACTTRSSTHWPAASRPSPAARSPARKPSRSSAPTAAASSTPTPRTRSRTPPRGPTGSRSSCCLVIAFSLPRTFGRMVDSTQAGLRDRRGHGRPSHCSA